MSKERVVVVKSPYKKELSITSRILSPIIVIILDYWARIVSDACYFWWFTGDKKDKD